MWQTTARRYKLLRPFPTVFGQLVLNPVGGYLEVRKTYIGWLAGLAGFHLCRQEGTGRHHKAK